MAEATSIRTYGQVSAGPCTRSKGEGSPVAATRRRRARVRARLPCYLPWVRVAPSEAWRSHTCHTC
jgi:hypothetical protein